MYFIKQTTQNFKKIYYQPKVPVTIKLQNFDVKLFFSTSLVFQLLTQTITRWPTDLRLFFKKKFKSIHNWGNNHLDFIVFDALLAKERQPIGQSNVIQYVFCWI